MHRLPHDQYHHQNGTFVTVDKPTSIHHNHPKSIVYNTVHSWCYMFYELDRCIMTCIHNTCMTCIHNTESWSIFTTLKIPYVPAIYPSVTLNPC